MIAIERSAMPARELQRKPRAEAVVAKALVRAAQRLGVSQSELAEVLGTSAASVSRTFGGERPIAPDSAEGRPYRLYPPFRAPPLRNGSRFGTRLLRGILYGARELPTALAEVAYYRLVFLDGSAADLGDLHLDLTAFWFGISATRGVDLSEPPFSVHEAQISSPTRYAAAQRLGAEMRGAGVQACLYVSARAEDRRLNVAVFENVFRPGRPLREEPW